MYGKKRIKIEKTGTIILAGGKSYIPIGRFYKKDDQSLIGRLRDPDSWDLKLNELNSSEFNHKSLKSLREHVQKVYSGRLIN